MQVDSEHVVILSQKMCGKYKPKLSHDHVRMTILHNLLTIILCLWNSIAIEMLNVLLDKF